MEQHVPFIEVGGAGVDIGHYSLKSGKFKIIDVRKDTK
jgi:hypothetical protein